MKRKFYEYIMIILVYRNTKDLIECLVSINKNMINNHVILVNAYYDEKTCSKVSEIAKEYGCDFINVENKGYGFGNNLGITYAERCYEYNYIVVLNPDTIIKKFKMCRESLKGDIIAPKIVTINGKNQNPMLVKENFIAEKLIYIGFVKEQQLYIKVGIAMNKILRLLFLTKCVFIKKAVYPIYAAHGSFVLIKKEAIVAMQGKPYDENIFLFAEENVLARKAKLLKLQTIYTPDIEIYHKEDGSINVSDITVERELMKSNIYYFEKYRFN